ncbi:MAG TPA: class I SAM-dependent methyltransferase [Gemmatimonadales bacterium]|nr:class I SAM-dependent methyltransferase [Gemmatimonadales bacterium]
MPESFTDHFAPVAGAYAAHRPRYDEALFDWLATLAPRRTLAWDCGAGSGQATLPLADRFERVVGTDASAGQLAGAPTHARIEWRVAPAERSGLASASADLVTVAQALHWFDVPAFYREVDRVLAPGGVLAVWTYNRHRTDDPAVDEVVDRFYSETVGPYWPPERRLVEEGYRALPFPYPQLPAPPFRMEARWSLAELLGYIGSWSAVARYRAVRGSDPLVPLSRELESRWGNPAATRPVRWALTVRAGRRPGGTDSGP